MFLRWKYPVAASAVIALVLTVAVACTPVGPYVPDDTPSPIDLTATVKITSEIQFRLDAVGIDAGPVDGVDGPKTTQAWHTFLATNGLSDATTSDWLGAVDVLRQQSTGGYAVEVLQYARPQQVVVLRNGRTIVTDEASAASGRLFTAPDGSIERAITPSGSFATSRTFDGWVSSNLGFGWLYEPWFFVGGIALHGSNYVTGLPASHGCVRLHLPLAHALHVTLSVGTPVRVIGDTIPVD